MTGISTRRHTNEDGVALIASLLVMMVCVILVAAALDLAIHTSQRSALSRNRTAALHAAEAGVEAELASLSQNSACPAPTGVVQLPDQNLPAESYSVTTVSCAAGGNAVVASTGYVPSATRPVATTTIVAHINRGQGAPVSPGSGTNGGYVFPDAIFSGGTVTATSPNTLSAFGTGGSVPNVVGNGNIAINGSQLDGLVHGWGTVTLNVAGIGGEVVGNGVNISGATVQAQAVAGGAGGVVSAGNLTLAGTTVNGTAQYKGAYSATGSTVTGGATANSSIALPNQRQMPVFTDSQSDMQSILGVGAPQATCPGNGTGSYYDVQSLLVVCTYNPPVINGTVVIVVRGGVGSLLTVNIPQTTTGAQLYVIAAGGALDALTINGTNSNTQVFAYTDGTLTVNGGLTGQLVGGNVATNGPTTLTFAPPATPAPDFAFNNSQVAPSGLGYAATVGYQYQCPGTAAC